MSAFEKRVYFQRNFQHRRSYERFSASLVSSAQTCQKGTITNDYHRLLLDSFPMNSQGVALSREVKLVVAPSREFEHHLEW